MREAYLVCYDISVDKSRRRVDKLLTSYGERIQYSVFEIVASEEDMKQLRSQIRQVIDPQTDAINYYRICPWCRSAIQTQGSAQMPSTQSHICV